VASLLDREAVAIRAGHHCAQPLHERLGQPATGRASFSVYSSRDDLDRLAAGLRGVQRVFGRVPRAASTAAFTPAASSPVTSPATVREVLPSAPVRGGSPS
jgi:hypothetical protein